MKTLKHIGIGLLVLIALLVIIGFFLPAKIHVERSISIKAPASIPFSFVNDFTKWKLWNAWHRMDTATIYQFSTPSSGKDAWFTWESEVTGEGKIRFTEITEFELIKAKLQLQEYESEASFGFKEQNGATQATWTLDSDMGMNPFARWMGLFMNSVIGKDFESGLQGLKELSEKTPPVETVAGFEVLHREISAQQYIYIESKDVKPEEISIKIGESLMKLSTFATVRQKLLSTTFNENHQEITGHPFTIWQDMQHFSTALPVTHPINGHNEIKFVDEKPYRAIVIKYYGAYDKNQQVYDSAFQYLKNKNLTLSGAPREVYVSDPMLEKDTAKWLTEMIFPIGE